MNEIENLIEQAKGVKRAWRKPVVYPALSGRTWQEILDNAPYPRLRIGKL